MSVGDDSSEKRKLGTIEFYNKIKCGVDVADQMARQYLAKAGTRQWSISVFYDILDLACIDAFVLYKGRTGSSISRRDFILKLATELREDHLVERRAGRNTSERESSRTCDKSLKRKQC